MDFIFLKDTDFEKGRQYTIGGKAMNLYRLKEIYDNIPKFIVIPNEFFSSGIDEEFLVGETGSGYRVGIPALYKIDEKILGEFPVDTLFAVRSSAIAEDGAQHSFAGQYETCLFVPKEKLLGAILKVYASHRQARVEAYKDFHQLKKEDGIAVIVQEMINADVSGVGYGIDPISGSRQVKVINAVWGLGEGLVSGHLNADTYRVEQKHISSEIVDKEYKLVFNNDKGSGLVKAPLTETEKKGATISDVLLYQIAEVLGRLRSELGKPQDIEFAIKGENLFLLQTRPVTILNKVADRSGEKVVWDNSNIIESYPGVTTPLTFSFISKSYEGAYKLFSQFMGVDTKVIAKYADVFANTLGLIDGRVYYNLRNWYMMLAMLPGYSVNARFMEKMMGVKEQFDIPADLHLSKTVAWWRIVKMAVKMYRRFLSLPKERKKFQQLLNTTIDEYKHINYETKSANDLMLLYRQFEHRLLNNWKAPLLNDFFAMIWFGVLEKRCKAYLKTDNPNIHNDLLCGSNDIISVEPIHRTIGIATKIANSAGLRDLFMKNDALKVWKSLSGKQFEDADIRKDIDAYINDFGERCIGELKLETISYTQDPSLYIKLLQSYVKAGITKSTTQSTTEKRLREDAEKVVTEKLSSNPIKKYFLKAALRRTRSLVSNRENLRYERTRAFGIVRMIFAQLGKNFFSENIIAGPHDIFYLTKEEIFSFIEGTSVLQDIAKLIEVRKQGFESYKKMDAPAHRFATYGLVYHANQFIQELPDIVDGDLKGIGCSPGKVRAKVCVILNPENAQPLNGDILVTTSTDPGWVTLFPTAGGILVERGSLLSHSAIVSREMGKPCVVGVTGLTQILKTGDEVEMDGNTGVIKILHREG